MDEKEDEKATPILGFILDMIICILKVCFEKKITKLVTYNFWQSLVEHEKIQYYGNIRVISNSKHFHQWLLSSNFFLKIDVPIWLSKIFYKSKSYWQVSLR